MIWTKVSVACLSKSTIYGVGSRSRLIWKGNDPHLDKNEWTKSVPSIGEVSHYYISEDVPCIQAEKLLPTAVVILYIIFR